MIAIVGTQNVLDALRSNYILRLGCSEYMMRGGVIMERIGEKGKWAPSLIRFNEMVVTTFEQAGKVVHL